MGNPCWGCNNPTTYFYDEVDRLTKLTDALGNSTQYAYDTEGNRLSIIDANLNKTRYFYDSLNRLIKTIDAQNNQTAFSYAPSGVLISKRDANNNTIRYTYDALNRLTKKRYPDLTNVTYAYDSLSRLTTVIASPSGEAISHTYDALGRLTSVTYPNTMQVTYEYDQVGNRTKLTYPDASYLTYTYDALNRLTSVIASPQGEAISFAYDTLSRRTNLTLANGVTTSYSYDSLSRLLSINHQPLAISYSYTYDAVGNRLTKQSNEGTHNYTYDNIYQLTQVQSPDLTTKTYNFDKVGNRTTVEGLSPQGTVPYVSNNLNQYTSVIARSGSNEAISYSYDLNGNLTQVIASGSEAISYTYDYENRLIQGTVPEQGLSLRFTYDAFGRRIQKEVNGVIQAKYLYDGDNIILDLDQNNQIIAKYIYGPSIDEPLVMIKGSDVYYYSKDGLGSVVNLTDSTGNVVESYTYDEYGNLTTAPSQIGNRYLYTGREYDPEINLYYYRARYYDPTIGRFLTTDPIGYYGGINLYTYVGNNPINWIDPWGLDATVLNDSDGAYGLFGHNGIGVGNNTTGWDYYSQDGPNAAGGHTRHYNSYEEMMADQGGRYDRSHRIPSTPEQDQRMRDTAGRNLNNPYSANPYDPNRYHCGDLVNDTLEDGGIPHGQEGFGNIPNDAFEKIRRANPTNGVGSAGGSKNCKK